MAPNDPPDITNVTKTPNLNHDHQPSITETEGPDTTWHRIYNFIDKECTFYRVHLVGFVFIPLIASGIFYASNGQFHIKYIDALFLCYSAMTVTGLTTVNLSTITPWQQVIIYLLMIIGDITTISWIVVLVRKRFFRNHCEYVVAEHLRKRRLHRSRTEFIRSIAPPKWISYNPKSKEPQSAPANAPDPTDGQTSTTPTITSAPPIITATGATPGATLLAGELGLSLNTASLGNWNQEKEGESGAREDGLFSTEGARWSSSPTQHTSALPPLNTNGPHVDFALPSGASLRSQGYYRAMATGIPYPYPERTLTLSNPRQRRNPSLPGTPHPSAATGYSTSSKYRGLGQFPGPLELMNRFAQHAAPEKYEKLKRSMTVPNMRVLEEKDTAYLNFNLSTGRNSDFHTETLSDEQLEELGGTEYGALRLLSYIVPMYFFGTQLLAFIIFAPWLSTTKQYDDVFQAQPRLVNKTWFSLFQVMAAYTGGGLSLVDLNMLPFQTAYLMIFPMMFVIVAGNHALPIFLRFVIWISSKLVNKKSPTYAALSFLIDHPRRCFLYLFPSHQTWFLLFSLILFSSIEWIGFAVLNDGLSAYESLPIGVRVVGGLFQGIAARASGFSIVPLANFAPSLLFLYVVMMYIAVYPIAMSIRSTNVYEERSLGVYKFIPEDEYHEPQGLEKIKDRRERIGKYLYWHFRRQMSIDIWWLVWAVFFIAIVERNNLMDEDKKWFDLFRIIFELVSAFGGIGLSLGFPSDNYSFAGAMRPLSKLIIIVIMVRGRHRGLPVAVDRAIVLPREMVTSPQRTDSKVAINEKVPVAKEPQPIYSDFGA